MLFVISSDTWRRISMCRSNYCICCRKLNLWKESDFCTIARFAWGTWSRCWFNGLLKESSFISRLSTILIKVVVIIDFTWPLDTIMKISWQYKSASLIHISRMCKYLRNDEYWRLKWKSLDKEIELGSMSSFVSLPSYVVVYDNELSHISLVFNLKMSRTISALSPTASAPHLNTFQHGTLRDGCSMLLCFFSVYLMNIVRN